MANGKGKKKRRNRRIANSKRRNTADDYEDLERMFPLGVPHTKTCRDDYGKKQERYEINCSLFLNTKEACETSGDTITKEEIFDITNAAMDDFHLPAQRNDIASYLNILRGLIKHMPTDTNVSKRRMADIAYASYHMKTLARLEERTPEAPDVNKDSYKDDQEKRPMSRRYAVYGKKPSVEELVSSPTRIDFRLKPSFLQEIKPFIHMNIKLASETSNPNPEDALAISEKAHSIAETAIDFDPILKWSLEDDQYHKIAEILSDCLPTMDDTRLLDIAYASYHRCKLDDLEAINRHSSSFDEHKLSEINYKNKDIRQFFERMDTSTLEIRTPQTDARTYELDQKFYAWYCEHEKEHEKSRPTTQEEEDIQRLLLHRRSVMDPAREVHSFAEKLKSNMVYMDEYVALFEDMVKYPYIWMKLIIADPYYYSYSLEAMKILFVLADLQLQLDQMDDAKNTICLLEEVASTFEAEDNKSEFDFKMYELKLFATAKMGKAERFEEAEKFAKVLQDYEEHEQSPKLWEIAWNENLRIKRILGRENAFYISPSPIYKEVTELISTMEKCAFCGYLGLELAFCTKCQKAHYCNRKCQKLHWKVHQQYCCLNEKKIEKLMVSK